MDMQTFHPVFESGQVLTSTLLNDIIGFLEPQDRATRTSLSGIGIVCGLRPDWNDENNTLGLSRGIAVTSAGHLLIEDDSHFDRCRRYTLPLASAAKSSTAQQAETQYPFLFDGQTQHEAFELLETGFQASAGAAPAALSAAFVADKTVLLFVESTTESLKNCDLNDCTDKGARRQLGVRKLLVSQAIADRMLQLEAEIAGRPVDRANHPRLALPLVRMEKLNPAGSELHSLGDLYQRYLDCLVPAATALAAAMQAAWEAYRPLLEPLYPAARFPDGPVPPHHFLNLFAALAHAPVHLQYAYAAVHDMTLAYSEFSACAARFDAECAPDCARFPRHVLAGDVLTRASAFAGAPRSWNEYLSYDPRNARGGAAPEGLPAARRHHFLPSPALAAGQDRAAELRALFSRMVLLAQSFASRDLLDADIALTPSRDGSAPLGERAIPFYYRFEPDGDLFTNWSWRKARSLRFGDIHSSRFNYMANAHPLLLRQDDQDFIRIEGTLGKPLGSAMVTLIREKRRLGQSFSIQPVWLPLRRGERATQARAQALAAMRALLLCSLPGLELAFRAAMSGTFHSMAQLVERVGGLDATRTTRPGATKIAPTPAATSAAKSTIELLQPGQLKKRMALRDEVLNMARSSQTLQAGTVKMLAQNAAGEHTLAPLAIASIFDTVRDKAGGSELFDRVRAVSATLDVEGDKDQLSQAIYPSIALMARAEDLMKAASASSLAEFDSEAFDGALRQFADAHANYLARAELDPQKAGERIANANAFVARMPEWLRTPDSSVPKALASELDKLLEAQFAQFSLPAFARAHPGLEHKGGVPVGGSLVLLFVARTEVEAELTALLEKGVHARLDGELKQMLGEAFPDFSAATVRALLAASRNRSRDPLDDFIIVGDFCLPSHCCANACIEEAIERRAGTPLKPRPQRPPVPGPFVERTGRITLAVSAIRGGKLQAVRDATVEITDLASNEVLRHEMSSATATLDLPPGKYAAIVIQGDQRSQPQPIEVLEGQGTTVRLKLGA